MGKRKHAEYLEGGGDEKNGANKSLWKQKKLCAEVCEKGKKELVKGLRLAAAFERQKQGRRKKTAGSKGESGTVGRLEAEYTILKTLDMFKTADEHIRKTFTRVKSLKDHEALPEWTKEGEKQVHSKEALNVLARLYKAPAVKKVMDEMIDDLKTVLGIAPPGAGKNAAAPAILKAENGEKKPDKALKEKRRDVAMDDFSGSESDDDFAGFSDRIAGSSDDEASDGDEDEDQAPRGPQRAYSYSPSLSGSNSDSDADDSDDDTSLAVHPTKTKTKAPASLKPTTSTFLPSLSMANYISGSESEASDLDSEFGAPKKNRRGQRARQALWEKKYGEKAKHLSKPKDDRSKGWDSKRGATLDERGAGKERKEKKDNEKASWERGGGNRRERRAGQREAGEKGSAANAVPVKKREEKRDDVGSLHPSWAAAKAAKEKKMSIVPMGKKVVFD